MGLRLHQRAAYSCLCDPALVQAINDARGRRGQYISDEEAEALVEQIAYWDTTAPLQTINKPHK